MWIRSESCSNFSHLLLRLGLPLLLTLPAASLHSQLDHFPPVVFIGVQSVVSTTGLSSPAAVAVALDGTLFISDSGNNRVVKVSPAGVQSVAVSGTVMGLALKSPTGIAVDGSSALYLCDTGNNRVLRIPSGGSAAALGSGLLGPRGIAVSLDKHVYVADTGNNRVLDLFNGTQTALIAAADVVMGAKLSKPAALSWSGYSNGGNLYVLDTGNNRVLWGENFGGSMQFGQSFGTSLSSPAGIATRQVYYQNSLLYGVAFIADTGHGKLVVESEYQPVNSDWTWMETPAVTGLKSPGGTAIDASGNIFIADTGNNRIVKLATSPQVNFGTVNAVANSVTRPLTFAFTASTAAKAPAVLTQGVANLDFRNAGTGNCQAITYAVNSLCTVNVSFTPSGAGVRAGAINFSGTAYSAPVTTTTYLYGIGTGPQIVYEPGTQVTLASGLKSPRGVTLDAAGNAYVSEFGIGQITKVSPGGTKTVFAKLDNPTDVALDGAGNLYTPAANGDFGGFNLVSPGGTISQQYYGADEPASVAIDGQSVYSSDSESYRFFKDALLYGPSVEFDGLFSPGAIAFDSAGNVFVVDRDDWLVWKVTPQNSWTTVGRGFNRPGGIAVDASGTLYVADFGNNQVVEVFPSGAQKSLGSGFSGPIDVALDVKGNVYVVDMGNSRLVKVDRSTPPTVTFASTAVGKTSSDSPRVVAINNAGNANLTFAVPATGTNPILSANFKMGTATTCPQLTISSSATNLSPGNACLYAMSFSPSVSGAITGSLTITDNNLNGNKVTQSITLKGTATGAVAAIALSGLGRTYTGKPVIVTATTNPAGLPVNLTYNGSTTPPTRAGSYAVKASIANPAYQGSAAGTLVIAKSTPDVFWVTPKPMLHGTPLGPAQLNASSTVPGRFTYVPGAGSVPKPGRIRITAIFTPTDALNFNPANTSVSLVVK
jgi:sugar lactone lactonase YvrE